MNRYFEDSGYHLYQAGRNARKGLEAASESVTTRLERAVGREPEPTTTVEALTAEFDQVKAEIQAARERLDSRAR